MKILILIFGTLFGCFYSPVSAILSPPPVYWSPLPTGLQWYPQKWYPGRPFAEITDKVSSYVISMDQPSEYVLMEFGNSTILEGTDPSEPLTLLPRIMLLSHIVKNPDENLTVLQQSCQTSGLFVNYSMNVSFSDAVPVVAQEVADRGDEFLNGYVIILHDWYERNGFELAYSHYTQKLGTIVELTYKNYSNKSAWAGPMPTMEPGPFWHIPMEYGWKATWLGLLNDAFWPWLYTNSSGWLYCQKSGSAEFWAYDLSEQSWSFLCQEYFPWVWSPIVGWMAIIGQSDAGEWRWIANQRQFVWFCP